jgi:hypothetical protein
MVPADGVAGVAGMLPSFPSAFSSVNLHFDILKIERQRF